MAYRRAFLMLGVGGLVASAARTGAAGVEGGAEISGHTGTSSGAWACGPAARVQYGGLGARARIYLDSPDPAGSAAGGTQRPLGVSLGGGGVWESRKYSLIDCRGAPDGAPSGSQTICPTPPTGPVSAFNASVGYDLEPFGFRDSIGFRLGVLRYGRFVDSKDSSPTYKLLPEASLLGRVGPLRRPVLIAVGFGSYDASTMLRPGLWLGVDVPLGAGEFTVGGHLGYHQTFDSDLGLRLHLQLAAALGSAIDLVAGGAVTQGYQKRPEPEGSLALRFNGGI